MILLYDGLTVRVRALLAQHGWAQAAPALGEVRSLALACGARRLLWQIFAALGEAAVAEANAGAAERLWRLAREEVHFFGSHAGSEVLRDALQTRPEMWVFWRTPAV